MAVESGYDSGYIKDIGSELWRSLLIALGEKVTKNNLHGVLKRTAQRQKDTNASCGKKIQPLTNYTNWGEAIDVSQFYGRTTELETLITITRSDRHLQQSAGIVIVRFLFLRHNSVYNRIRKRSVIPDVFCIK